MTRHSVFMFGSGTALVALLLAATPSQAEPKIENLKNDKAARQSGGLTQAEIDAAVPAPEMEFSAEQLEEMRRRFRALNPGALELEAARPEDKALAKGVPETVDDPAANDPYWSTGRLVFRTQAGASQYCTAQYTGDLKVILTAAHCVRDPGSDSWNRDFTFLRAYNNGVAAQTVDWRCLSIFDAFHIPGINAAYDYAFILADSNDEKPALDMAIGTPVSQDLTAIGYPGNFGGGQSLYKVDGAWASVSGGIVTMQGNPMRKGNSGGAWFTNFKVDGGSGHNIVISVDSHNPPGNTDDENGPLFTPDTVRLFEHVRDGKCL